MTVDFLTELLNPGTMTTKNNGMWLNRGIYDSPYDAFTNYMNILGISPNVIFEKLIIHKDLETQMKLSKKASKLSDEKLDFIISVIDLLENI